YVTAKEMARQQLVFDHLERGDTELAKGRQVEALAEFRSALSLDPQNEFAQERLRDAEVTHTPGPPERSRVLADASVVRVEPNPIHADFHYRGEGRGLPSQVASASGIPATLRASGVSPQV